MFQPLRNAFGTSLGRENLVQNRVRLCCSRRLSLTQITQEENYFEKKTLKKSNLHAVKPIDLSSFCQKLRQCSANSALLLSDVKTTSDVANNSVGIETLPQLHSVNMIYCDSVLLNSKEFKAQFASYMVNLKCSEEDCKLIVMLTKGQNVCDMWTDAIIGRITSSVFVTVCKQKCKTKPDNVIRYVMNYKTVETNATRWGKSHEMAAHRIYKKIFRNYIQA